MIIFAAGAKPTTKSNIWEDPRQACGHDLSVMLTYWELKEKKLGWRKARFLRALAKKKIPEFWKPVVGLEKYYIVSSYGRVKSLERKRTITSRGTTYTRIHREKFLKRIPNIDGYPTVCLYGDDGSKGFRFVHHLVLEAFVGPKPNKKAQCRHLDDIKTNCHAENLVWGTGSENRSDAYRNGKRKNVKYSKGENHYKCKLSDEEVAEIKRLCKKGKYGTKSKLARKYGVSTQLISSLCLGRHRKEKQ